VQEGLVAILSNTVTAATLTSNIALSRHDTGVPTARHKPTAGVLHVHSSSMLSRANGMTPFVDLMAILDRLFAEENA
jgi:hypothetical protein